MVCGATRAAVRFHTWDSVPRGRRRRKDEADGRRSAHLMYAGSELATAQICSNSGVATRSRGRRMKSHLDGPRPRSRAAKSPYGDWGSAQVEWLRADAVTHVARRA